jgi:type I restriction enzyme S subunit
MDYRGKSPPKSDNGLPLITAKNIRMGFISQTPREFIPHSSYDYWMVRGIPTSNDIMITTEAPLGNVALCPTYKFALGQRVIAISLNESEINPRYLVYFIQTRFFQDQIKSASTGSTVSGVKQGTLLESFVAIPPIKEQNEILIKLDGIGGTLNELNQKATKLKGLKKSLMQDLLTGKVRVQVNQDGF